MPGGRKINRNYPSKKTSEKAPKSPTSRTDRIFSKANRAIKQHRGVPTEPSDYLIKVIQTLVKVGNYPDVAARSVGVNSYLFKKWLEKGMDDVLAGKRTPFSKFVLSLDAADAQAEATNVLLIGSRVHNWQALAWITERRQNQRWGPKVSAMLQTLEDRLNTSQNDQQLVDADTGAEILAILEKAGAFKKPLPSAEEQPIPVTEQNKKKPKRKT